MLLLREKHYRYHVVVVGGNAKTINYGMYVLSYPHMTGSGAGESASTLCV